MIKTTTNFGIVLIVIGLIAYVSLHEISVAALIPALLGMAMSLLGRSAKNEKYAKKSINAAVLLAFLGFLGAGLRVMDGMFNPAIKSIGVELIFQAALAVICAVYIGLAVKYYYEARFNK